MPVGNSLSETTRLAAEDAGPVALRGRPFFALCVPASADGVPALDADDGEEPFRWAREFTFVSQQDVKGAKAYAISLQEKGAFYTPVTANYVLGKRKRQDFAEVPVPESVRLAIKEQCRICLFHGGDDSAQLVALSMVRTSY